MMVASERGLPQAGIEPWTSINPMTFMTSQACFLLAGANAFESLGNITPESARKLAGEFERAMQTMQYQGTDTVEGRPTHKIAVEDLGGTLPAAGPPAPPSDSPADSARAEVTAMYRWIDAEYFVPRKLRIEGVMHAEGQSQEFFLEKLEQDYRNVPDSHLYEPYRTVLRMGGMLTPSQQAEMRESQGRLDELERRMAGMSPSERALTTRMMGDKIEQWRSLANDGAVEIVMVTTSIVINPDLSAGSTLMAPPAGPAVTTGPSPEELRAAQLACLQERAEAKRQAEKKKGGFGRLAGALTGAVASIGNSSMLRAASGVLSPDEESDELVAAAEKLGLTEEDAAACRSP